MYPSIYRIGLLVYIIRLAVIIAQHAPPQSQMVIPIPQQVGVKRKPPVQINSLAMKRKPINNILNRIRNH